MNFFGGEQLDVEPKIGGKQTPKMDGENSWKTLWTNGWFGWFYHIFGNTQLDSLKLTASLHLKISTYHHLGWQFGSSYWILRMTTYSCIIHLRYHGETIKLRKLRISSSSNYGSVENGMFPRLHPLKLTDLTAISHLKMDGWKMNFLLGPGLLTGANC